MIYQQAELYDAQYAHYRDDLHFYQRLAEDYGSPILELGCGSGRVTAALCKAGHQLVGLDLSEEMLAQAHTRLAAVKPGSATLLPADMRNFELGQTFPLIIAAFNTLMHLYTLTDQDAALACVRRHLQADGAFTFDLYVPHFSALERLKRVSEWQHVGGDMAELFVYQTHEADKQLIHSTYYLDERQPDGQLRRQVSQLTQRYYTRFELERALAQAGFTAVRIFGGFERQPFSAEATHLVVLAK